MKKLLVLIVSTVFFFSCKDGSDKSQTSVPDVDTVRHSDSFNGVFTGVTPCADCPGIYTVLQFSPDMYFFEYLKYLDRDAHFADTGVWKVQDSIITVSFKNNRQNRFYKILNDTTVKMLDSDQKGIIGPGENFYILKRKDTLIPR